MLTNLLFLIIILCGVVAGIFLTKRRFEELLPINTMGIILILFLTGILGIPLSVGAVIVIILYIGIFACSGVFTIKKEKGQTVRHLKDNLLTPAFVVFLFIFFALSYFDNGKLATGWDEFTHWIDSVKTMVTVDDFVTNPASGSMFSNYPPSMSLFQFFLERLYLWMHPGELFNEWRVYFAYQILSVSLIMPFLKKLQFRRPVEIILLPLIILLAPVLLYKDFYMSLYIDAFLGVCAGCGMAYIFIHREKDRTDLVYLGLLLFTLTLAKDAGRLLSLFVALTFVLEQWHQNRKEILEKATIWKQKIRLIILPLLMLLPAYLPHLLWNNELRISGIPSASVPVRFTTFLSILWFGQTDTEYARDNVVQSFSHEFFAERLHIGQLSVGYAFLTVILILLFILAVICYQKKVERDIGRSILISIMMFLMLAVYVLGLGALYISRFTDYEAENLASFDRFMGIGYLAVLEFLVLIAVWILTNLEAIASAALSALLLLFSVCTGPVDQMKFYLSRESVAVSNAYRSGYEEVASKIRKLPEDTDIYMVSEESSGEDFNVFRYVLKPWKLSGTGSLGGPFYEGDCFSIQISADDWMDSLMNSYDYVVLNNLNDYFLNTYGDLFEDPDRIVSHGLYRVDKDNRKLVFVE